MIYKIICEIAEADEIRLTKLDLYKFEKKSDINQA